MLPVNGMFHFSSMLFLSPIRILSIMKLTDSLSLSTGEEKKREWKESNDDDDRYSIIPRIGIFIPKHLLQSFLFDHYSPTMSTHTFLSSSSIFGHTKHDGEERERVRKSKKEMKRLEK